MTDVFHQVVERDVNPGIGIFELVDDPELVGGEDWAGQGGTVRVQPGRILVETADREYRPEIVLRAWLSEPEVISRGPDADGLQVRGTWKTSFHRHQVEAWSGDVMPGTVTLYLPADVGAEFCVRITVEQLNRGGMGLEDYIEECFGAHGRAPLGVERFTVDFWPTALAAPTAVQRWADDPRSTATMPKLEEAWTDPIEQPGRLFERLVSSSVGSGDRVFDIVDDTERSQAGDWTETDEPVRVQPGRISVRLDTGSPKPLIVVSTYTGEPSPDQLPAEYARDTSLLGVWPVVFSTGEIQLWSDSGYDGPVALPGPWTQFAVRIAINARPRPENRSTFVIDIWPRNDSDVRE